MEMFKKKFAKIALYLLFLVNCVYAAMDGVSWLFVVTAVLTAIVLVLDVMEALKNGNRK